MKTALIIFFAFILFLSCESIKVFVLFGNDNMNERKIIGEYEYIRYHYSGTKYHYYLTLKKSRNFEWQNLNPLDSTATNVTGQWKVEIPYLYLYPEIKGTACPEKLVCHFNSMFHPRETLSSLDSGYISHRVEEYIKIPTE